MKRTYTHIDNGQDESGVEVIDHEYSEGILVGQSDHEDLVWVRKSSIPALIRELEKYATPEEDAPCASCEGTSSHHQALCPAHPAALIKTGRHDRFGRDIYTSAFALLARGISCREVRERGWSAYPNEDGTFNFYPGDEGPQVAQDFAEVRGWIGQDCEAALTRAGADQIKHLGD